MNEPDVVFQFGFDLEPGITDVTDVGALRVVVHLVRPHPAPGGVGLTTQRARKLPDACNKPSRCDWLNVNLVNGY